MIENLRTHKKLEFKIWPRSVLINQEILLFPALLEKRLKHAHGSSQILRQILLTLRGDTKSWYTPFLQGHPNPETDHQTFWVIPILIHTLLHQVIPNTETDRQTLFSTPEETKQLRHKETMPTEPAELLSNQTTITYYILGYWSGGMRGAVE